MPVNRLVALARAAAAYRVEACFVAALAFSLAHQADDRRHDGLEVRTTTTRHTVVHEVQPVRIVTSHARQPAVAPRAAVEPRSARRATAPRTTGPTGERTRYVRVPADAPVVASGGRIHVSASGEKIMFMKTDAGAFDYCAALGKGASAAGSGGSCKVVRVSPTAAGAAVAKVAGPS